MVSHNLGKYVGLKIELLTPRCDPDHSQLTLTLYLTRQTREDQKEIDVKEGATERKRRRKVSDQTKSIEKRIEEEKGGREE